MSSAGQPGGEHHLARNVMHFARLLRAAGLAIGSGSVSLAVQTVAAVGIDRRDDVYWALHAALVRRPEDQSLFHQAFQLFWRDRQAIPDILAEILASAQIPAEPPRQKVKRRLGEAFAPARSRAPAPARRSEIEARLAYSDAEVLRKKDFEQMSSDELREAREAVRRLRLDVSPLRTRRSRPARRAGKVDLRATLRSCARAGTQDIPLRWRESRWRQPRLVALCDVSGSMTHYARMVLHFLHALTDVRDVETFLFATRLTRVTRYLAHRDVDEALALAGQHVQDWGGGTRIGPCLRSFNLLWARRVLGQGAVVLLISDGLDRADGEDLGLEMARLRRSCRRLIWLNPLLRYEGFEPRAGGIRAMLPHVDDFRRVHNLESLEQLARSLGRGTERLSPGG